MIETILIANRGEIARRIGRTCREMGIRTVAVYSDADVDMPSVAEADLALRLGPPPAAESYLDIEKIIALAQGNGVDAIHPGYGFLAENPAFSEACARAGIIFIGPSAEVIRAMGDKAEAKRIMAKAGVPVVPGYTGQNGGEEPDDETLRREALAVGFPLLLKAIAGGGGRGIRLVESESELEDAIASARREATGAFGDGRLMIEKFLSEPRHVEFQVMADTHGNALHLFERECSVQRRHQKIIEETPSPALNDTRRASMAEAALLATRAIDYVGAGTVEFLVDGEGKFYFLEMNTRLQVEHPVTEFTLGLDLVRMQIEVAGGGTLQITQEDLHPRGHAIECRLNAEDPARGFLPSVGPLHAFDFPEGPGLRVDAGFAAGTALSPYYDSLVAKLIAWGETREEALRRMGRLLAGARVAGIATNLSFLQGVIGHEAFRSGNYTTGFLEEHGEHLTAPVLPPNLLRERLLAAASIDAWLAFHEPDPATPDAAPPSPWLRMDGSPRPEGVPARLLRRYIFPEGNVQATIEVRPDGAGNATGPTLAVAVSSEEDALQARYVPDGPPDSSIQGGHSRDPLQGEGLLDLAELRLPLRWHADGPKRWVSLRGHHMAFTVEDPAHDGERTASGEEAAERLRAPLPGKVLQVSVKEGDSVRADQVLLVLEAMKVEHTITAPYSGTVTGIRFGEGEQVNRDDTLIDLEPAEQEKD